jgi:hypothetical protein
VGMISALMSLVGVSLEGEWVWRYGLCTNGLYVFGAVDS